MSHTPEPWAVDPLYGFVIDKNGEPIDLCGSYEASLNMDRLVICVNACEGIPTDDLEMAPEKGLFYLAEFANTAAIERDTYRDLCGELSSVLADALPLLSKYIPKSHITEICIEVKSAINKAEKIMGDGNGQ